MKLKSGPKIHIIDKSSSYRKVVAGMIHALGYSSITTSDSCEQFLSGKASPDIVILDYIMGEKRQTGLSFMQKYSALKFPGTKFIFLSSCTNLDIAVSCIRSGAFDYIIKSKSGLERLVNRIELLVTTYYVNMRIKKQIRAAIVSLGMIGILFVLGILLYYH